MIGWAAGRLSHRLGIDSERLNVIEPTVVILLLPVIVCSAARYVSRPRISGCDLAQIVIYRRIRNAPSTLSLLGPDFVDCERRLDLFLGVLLD